MLLVTPELAETVHLKRSDQAPPKAKAGGLADAVALLADSLWDAGMDVHVAMPHYRTLFGGHSADTPRRFHLCQDREFFYRRSVYDGCADSNRHAALAFQRDVIHHVLPKVRPALVHCHDWMTGMIPAAAKSLGIPSIFTLHNLHDCRSTLAEAEDRGIDAARFWNHLHYEWYPESYEAARGRNPLGMLASGVHAADHVTTVSPGFLTELSQGWHQSSAALRNLILAKQHRQGATGILNALGNALQPDRDPHLAESYGPAHSIHGKRSNKLALQQELGLEIDPDAPLLFWPSRLDPEQKGCQLLADLLYRLVSDYWGLGLQIVFVADGPAQCHFHHIADFHQLRHRIAVRSFEERLSRFAYAASDFMLMPSRYEPCGLAQMMGLRYGSLPVVHATGGLRDTVRHLEPSGGSGNGFVFHHYDSQGLRWAIDEAIRWYLKPDQRQRDLRRIMEDSVTAFSPEFMVRQYVSIYRSLLG